MGPEEYYINGVYLRGYLASLRKLTGHQYVRLLTQAGLEKFAEKYPPLDGSVVARGQQLIALNNAVNQTIGDDLFDLFMRNMGREFGRYTAYHPGYLAAAKETSPITDQASFRRLLEKLIPLNLENMNAPMHLEETADNNGFVLVYDGCIYCAHRTKAEKPVCAGVSTYYKEMLLALTGHRYRIDEVVCGPASSGPDCHFLLRRA